MTTAPPPRLHVLLRPGSPRAVILRRGGTKRFCTLGWTLANDDIQLGQWCKHKLYPYRCDVSADGKWLLYFALNGRWKSETRGSWTAVSRAPYLKAVRLWPQGDTWGGGGLLYDARAPGDRSLAHMTRIDERTYSGSGLYADRLLRDGWTHDGKPRPGGGGKAYEKPFGKGWILRKKVVDVTESHQLVTADGELLARPTWEWAEVDAARQRVVYADGGVLYAARIDEDGLREATVLFDARPMQFEPLIAPYDDEVVFGG